MRIFVLSPILIALAGCGQSDSDPGPGGVTIGEARALDDAAEMIEARRLPPDALPTAAPTQAPPETGRATAAE